ncbi:hypothetical protein [Simkania negevensis]|uniref:Uncharacterized protein n=1 Tax=Simkania negevensis (strain ATCC VR-1471 / DSM 27360 / Z) TaxID=331113 RepID=F8L7A3_SIMNZ|nr:hypothetical protein [Simkania negevensis]CCB88624.1 unknown protein [Simkania negevensis Z]
MTTRVRLYSPQYAVYGSPEPHKNARHLPNSTSLYSSAHLQRPLIIPTNPYRKNTHGSSPVFIVKLTAVGGEIKSVIARRFGVDPLKLLMAYILQLGNRKVYATLLCHQKNLLF